MIIHRIFTAITALVITVAAANSRTLYDYAVVPMPGSNMPFSLTVDSIEMRSDVARIYGHIYGTPHTSARIDGFFIKPAAEAVPIGTKIVEEEAFDIDGFEFTHRFQWEDNGDIPVEIDFKPFPEADLYFIRITHPNGWFGLSLRKTHATRSKQKRIR
ncbi:MAG: hypothetical protein HDR92_10915 [Bacteroides sp.]|nr:hypothetical protein [Bacteroides sp.]